MFAHEYGHAHLGHQRLSLDNLNDEQYVEVFKTRAENEVINITNDKAFTDLIKASQLTAEERKIVDDFTRSNQIYLARNKLIVAAYNTYKFLERFDQERGKEIRSMGGTDYPKYLQLLKDTRNNLRVIITEPNFLTVLPKTMKWINEYVQLLSSYKIGGNPTAFKALFESVNNYHAETGY